MSVPAPGYPHNWTPQIDIGWLVRGWDSFKEKAGTWVAVMLLVGLVLAPFLVGLAFLTGYAQYMIATFQTILHGTPAPPQTFSIMIRRTGGDLLFSLLAGAMGYLGFGCYYRLALSQLRSEPVNVGTAFSALRSALPLLVVGVAVQVMYVIGSYLCLLPGLIVQGLFMFAPLLVLDRGLGPVSALAESFSLVKSQWVMAAVFYFLGQLLAGVGGLLLGVGAFITYPLFILGVTIAYLTFTQPPAPPAMPDYGQAVPGVWPPPPGSSPPGGGPT